MKASRTGCCYMHIHAPTRQHSLAVWVTPLCTAPYAHPLLPPSSLITLQGTHAPAHAAAGPCAGSAPRRDEGGALRSRLPHLPHPSWAWLPRLRQRPQPPASREGEELARCGLLQAGRLGARHRGRHAMRRPPLPLLQARRPRWCLAPPAGTKSWQATPRPWWVVWAVRGGHNQFLHHLRLHCCSCTAHTLGPCFQAQGASATHPLGAGRRSRLTRQGT